MKIILLVLLSFSVCSFATDNLEVCKKAGIKAKKIMTKRQSGKDLFKILEQYKSKSDKAMVLAAYQIPHHDSFAQLSIAIDAFGERSYEDEMRKYNKLDKLSDNAIEQFKNKYIKKCIEGKLKTKKDPKKGSRVVGLK